MSERQPPRHSRAMVYGILSAVLLIAGLLLWWFLRSPDLAKYAPLIHAAQTNTLPPENNGTIDLSKTFPGITDHDLMYLRRWPGGRFAAFFPQFTAPGPAVAGLMYVSAPLQPDDTFLLERLINFQKPLIAISSWKRLRIDRKLDEHWYRVSYGLE